MTSFSKLPACLPAPCAVVSADECRRGMCSHESSIKRAKKLLRPAWSWPKGVPCRNRWKCRLPHRRRSILRLLPRQPTITRWSRKISACCAWMIWHRLPEIAGLPSNTGCMPMFYASGRIAAPAFTRTSRLPARTPCWGARWRFMRPATPDAFLGQKAALVGYAPSGTGWLASKLRKTLRPEINAYLMRNHGVVCCGPTLGETVARVEALE